MDARRESKSAPMENRTTVERKSERELVVTRTFNGPAHIVFEAWTKPELFKRWWVPKSMGMSLLSCEMDVRVGGKYRLEFGHPAAEQPVAFFGTYKEVTPYSRLVWTNEESDEGSVTTVTFEEKGGKTLLVMHELYPSKEALDAAGTGAADVTVETFAQLDELLVSQGVQMRKIVTFLWFNDHAKEAVDLYVSLFENAKIINTSYLTESVAEAAGKKPGDISSIDFELNGQNFTALNGGPMYTLSEATSIAVNCKTQEEIDKLWEALSKGGKIMSCGWLIDKYGLTWQIMPESLDIMMRDPDTAKADRVSAAMLSMEKLNISELEKAYNSAG